MQATRGASLNASEDEAPKITGDLPSSGRVRTIWLVTAVVAYSVDLGTKILAVRHLEPFETVPLAGDLFGLYLTRNPGAAFSTGTSMTELLSVFAIVALGVVIFLSVRLGSRLWAVALGFLAAGIAGNLTDRLFRAPGPLQGHVVDMLRLPNWPIFNFADIFINIAAGLIILQAIRGVRLDGTRDSAEEDDPEPETATQSRPEEDPTTDSSGDPDGDREPEDGPTDGESTQSRDE